MSFIKNYPADLMSTADYVIRMFNAQSRPKDLADGCLAASDVCRTTDSAAELTHGMRQAVTQLTTILQRSAAFDLHDRLLHPEDVAVAVGALQEAAQALGVAAQYLCDAHAAIIHPDPSRSAAG
jgi:hypothetical protein